MQRFWVMSGHGQQTRWQLRAGCVQKESAQRLKERWHEAAVFDPDACLPGAGEVDQLGATDWRFESRPQPEGNEDGADGKPRERLDGDAPRLGRGWRGRVIGVGVHEVLAISNAGTR